MKATTSSLSAMSRWLAQQAEALGVEVFLVSLLRKCCITMMAQSKASPLAIWVSIAKAKLHHRSRSVWNCMRSTICSQKALRGHLGKQMIAKYEWTRQRSAILRYRYQRVVEIDPKHHKPGLVVHTTGWPMFNRYAGSFLYHLENNQVAVGYVVGLMRIHTFHRSKNSNVSKPSCNSHLFRRCETACPTVLAQSLLVVCNLYLS